MGKKEALANLLYRSGLLRLLPYMRKDGIIVLGYHRIRSGDGQEDSLLDEGVYGPTRDGFEQQVKWLRGNLDILRESELLEILISRKKIRGRYAVITFDDGYRDNYDLVYPVLKAYSVPAIFFVCPGLIETGRLAWWDLIAYFANKSQKAAITVGGETFPLGAQRSATIATLHGWMKKKPSHETGDLLEELSAACGVAIPDRRSQPDQFMSWAQLREVSRNGVAIGSHTYHHSVLATLDEAAQQRELWDSKLMLEQRLGLRVRTVAYPAGVYGNFTAATMRIARECGYDGAFSFRSGFNAAGAVNPYDIRRVVAGADAGPMFACGMYMPGTFTW